MTDTTTYDDRRPSGRHPVNVGQLVMGLAFLGLVGIWGLVESGVAHSHDVRWLLPVPWVVAGAAGLVAATLSNRRRRREDPWDDRWGGRWGSHQTGWVRPTTEEPAFFHTDEPAFFHTDEPEATEPTTESRTDEPGTDEPDTPEETR